MKTRLVSVIIPVYNREDIIGEAINTVLSQTFQNFEIIIVDDGSSDSTAHAVKKISDDRIKYIYQPNSGKPSLARNTGIHQAQGEYIAFLDSDDLWHPQMLAKHINAMQKNENIGFSTNWSSYRTFGGRELYQKKCLAENKKEYLKYILLSPDKAYTGTGSTLIKKEALAKAGFFDEEMTFCEDWDLFFRLAACSELFNIKEIFTYVRIHRESICKTNDVSKFKEGYLTFLQKAFANKNLPTNLLKIKNKAYSNSYWRIGYWALYKSKDYANARKSLLKSFSYCFYDKMLNIRFVIAFILAFSPREILRIYEQIRNAYRKALGKHIIGN